MSFVKNEEICSVSSNSIMNPILSIVVPIYNVEKYLSRCLDSLINQTLKEIEIILVNDGSTDKSGEICHFYAQKDKRIKLYSKINGGLSDARNYGIKKATAAVIGFVDSDDYVDIDMFRVLLELKKESSAEIAVGGVKMVSNDEKEYQIRSLEKEAVYNRHDAMEELLKSKRITNSVCNKLFDKVLFEGIEFPFGKLYEDEYVTYRLFDRANKIAMTNTVFYYYRSSPNSITHKMFTEKEFDRIYASEIKVDYIRENYPDLVALAQRYLVYDCVMALSKMQRYKRTYNVLIRDNIRRNLKCFLVGDYSVGTKAFAVVASVSPTIGVYVYNKLFTHL